MSISSCHFEDGHVGHALSCAVQRIPARDSQNALASRHRNRLLRKPTGKPVARQTAQPSDKLLERKARTGSAGNTMAGTGIAQGGIDEGDE